MRNLTKKKYYDTIPKCPKCHASTTVGGITPNTFFCSECCIEFTMHNNQYSVCYDLTAEGNKVRTRSLNKNEKERYISA